MERYFTEGEQESLLRTLKQRCFTPLGRRDEAMTRALVLSGCRLGEFLQVSVGDAIAALHTRYLFIPKEHRKGKRRDHSVFVTRKLDAALRDLLRVRHELAPENCPETDPLIVGRTGAGITVRAWELRFKHAVLAAGLPRGASPHWLRHTRAMNIIESSGSKNPLGLVQSALGHASLSSTGVYTRTPRGELERALEQVDGPRRVSQAALRKAYEGRSAA